MIDGIKLSAVIPAPLQEWSDETGIKLSTRVDSKTGNQSFKERVNGNTIIRVANYYGFFQRYKLSIKYVQNINKEGEVFETNHMTITGSLHCNSQNGSNIENFTFNEMIKEIYNLCDGLKLQADRVKIDNLEFGVNIPFHEPVFNFLRRNLIQYKGNSFNRYDPDKTGKVIGYYAPMSQYQVKVYDKSLQYDLSGNIMRYERRYIKMQPLSQANIKMLSDLLNASNIKKLSTLLLKSWNEVLIYDDVIDLVKPERAKEWKNPKYWESIKDSNIRRFNDHRRKFKLAIDQKVDNAHSQINKQIEATLNELLQCTNLPHDENAEEYNLTIKIKGKNSSTTKSEVRKCLSCGRDISSQKSNSRFCSEKEVGEKNAHSCRNKISNLKKKIFREQQNGILFPIQQTYILTPPVVEVIKSLEI
jgi:hypothetical protein